MLKQRFAAMIQKCTDESCLFGTTTFLVHDNKEGNPQNRA